MTRTACPSKAAGRRRQAVGWRAGLRHRRSGHGCRWPLLAVGLEVGVADIRAGRPGVAVTRSMPVPVEAGRRSTADFVLPATGIVEGEVRFSGARHPDAAVIVEFVPDRQQMRSRDFGQIEVGEEGHFRAELPVGAFRVFAATSDGRATNDWLKTKVEAGKTTQTRARLEGRQGRPNPPRRRCPGARRRASRECLRGSIGAGFLGAEHDGRYRARGADRRHRDPPPSRRRRVAACRARSRSRRRRGRQWSDSSRKPPFAAVWSPTVDRRFRASPCWWSRPWPRGPASAREFGASTGDRFELVRRPFWPDPPRRHDVRWPRRGGVALTQSW